MTPTCRNICACLLAGGALAAVAAPAEAAWPGAEGRLSFSSNRLTGSESRGDIFTAWADGGDVRPLIDDTRDDAQSSWSPDGLSVAWRARRIVSFNLHAVGWDGAGEQTVVGERAFDETQPSYSPDGAALLYRRSLRTVAAQRGDIWEAALDGTDARPVLVTPDDERYPAYSPDGTRIAFRSNPDGNPDIFVLDVATREVTQLTHEPGHDSAPAWSPDGTRLAFESDRAGSMDVYVMDATGGGVTRLTDDPALDEGPAWSPDGSRIAFTSERTGDGDIFVMAADGTGQRNVTNHPATEQSPDWQPVPHADGAWTPCGDAAPAFGVQVEGTSCETARRVAGGWDAAPAPGGRPGRVGGYDCAAEPHSFGQSLVTCEHRGASKRLLFVSRSGS